MLIPISIESRNQMRFIRLFMKDWLLWRQKLISRFKINSSMDAHNSGSIINSLWYTIIFLFYESIDMMIRNSRSISMGFFIFIFFQNYLIQYNNVMDDVYSFIDLNKYFSSFYDRDSSMPALEMEEDEDNNEIDGKVEEESEREKMMKRINRKKGVQKQDIRSQIEVEDYYKSSANIHKVTDMNGSAAEDFVINQNNSIGNESIYNNGNSHNIDSLHSYGHCQWQSSNSNYKSNSTSNSSNVSKYEEEKEPPGDLLVYDEIFGVVPLEVLRTWEAQAKAKERKKERERKAVTERRIGDICEIHDSTNKSIQLTYKKVLPPVRFSIN